jgi:hypothetical protein
MDSDEYQLMSRKELIDLKEQLKRVKEGSTSPSRSMPDAMQSLQRTMLELIGIFREASDTLKEDDSQISIAKKLNEISSKIDVLVDQNEKIAGGILSVADLIKEKQPEKPAPGLEPLPAFPPPMGAPSFGPPSGPPPSPPPFPQRMPPKRQFPAFI